MPNAPVPKRGLGVGAWIAIGCGGLLLLGLIIFLVAGWFVARKVKEVAANPALAAAKVIDMANPDIELVSSDDTARTVTFKKTATGETFTFSWDDIEQGRFSITDGSGSTTTLGVDESGSAGMVTRNADGEVTQEVGVAGDQQPPAWFPVAPGAINQGGWVATTQEGQQGLLNFKFTGDKAEVLAFYRTELEGAGFTVESSSYSAGNSGVDVLTARDDSTGRSATITLGTGEADVFAVTFDSPTQQ
jgi:hypothetical protein